MNRRHAFAAAAAAALPAEAQWTNPFAQAFLKSFVEHWKDTREYTLNILDAMPAGKFTLKADPAQRTFGEQLIHIAGANTAYFRGFELAEPPALKPPDPSSKDDVRAYLTAHFDFTDAVLAKMTQAHVVKSDIRWSPRQKPHSTVDIFLRAYMHTAHHRGQIVSYLRVAGIVPPSWKFEPHA